MSADESILRVINTWSQVPLIASGAMFLSSLWILLVVSVPLAAVIIVRKKKGALVAVLLATALTDRLVVDVVKPLAARVRPCRSLQGLNLPAGCGPGESFPSGHAANAFAYAVAGGTSLRFGLAALLPVAALVSGSRMVLGVHYPSDVAAGALFGAAIGALFAWSRARWVRSRTPLRDGDPPGTTPPATP